MLSLDPRKDALMTMKMSLKRGELGQAHASLQSLSALLIRDRDEALEVKINELKFMIETHVFAGQFNAQLIEQLRCDYIDYLTKGNRINNLATAKAAPSRFAL